MPRCIGKKALMTELSSIRDLCKLPTDRTQYTLVINFLKENRYYISLIAAAASEIRARFAPEPVCVFLDVMNGKPVISVSAESEEVDIQAGLEDFFAEWYDPVSIDLGCIRFDAMDNWATTRVTPGKLAGLISFSE